MTRDDATGLTRRDMLRMGAGALLACGLWPGRLARGEAPASGDFSFIAVNDLHLRDEQCVPWFENVVKQMKSSAPKAEFCLLGGDQADNGRPEQLAHVREIFSRLGMPLYAVVGNHDYLVDNTRGPYESIFPAQINYSFEHAGWQVLALDTTQGTDSLNTVISPVTLRWMDGHLPKLDPSKPLIVLTHFPMGRDVFTRPRNADDLLNRLLGFNLQAIFSGHYHGYTERVVRHATLTTDKCCSRVRANHDGTREKGWFVCEAAGGRVSRKFVVFNA